MERADNRESVVSLPVDVNENENLCKAYTSLSDCKEGLTDRTPRLLNDECDHAYTVEDGLSAVYIANNGKDLNSIGAKLQEDKNIVLDSVSECASQTSDSCVALERCGNCSQNGFPEPVVELTVGSQVGGGESGAVPSSSTAAASADRPQEENGMLTSARVSKAGELESATVKAEESNGNKLDEGHSNFKPRPKTAVFTPTVSCIDKHQSSCSCTVPPPPGMKILNGDVNYGRMDPFPISQTSMDCCYVQPNVTEQLPGVKLANGGLLIVNQRVLCDVKSEHTVGTKCPFPDADSRAFLHHIENIRSSPESREISSRESCQLSGECSPVAGAQDSLHVDPEYGDTVSELSARLSVSSLPEHTSDHSDTEPSLKPTEDGFPVRPRSLRTNPGYVVSLSCDATPLSLDDREGFTEEAEVGLETKNSRNTYEVSRRLSAPDNLPDGLNVDPEFFADQRLSTKKHGIAEFLTRSLFSWKSKEPKTASQSAPGWKLFGQIPLRENPPKDSRTIQQEYKARAGPGMGPHLQPQPTRRRNLEFEPLSTTALILEDRPANLPAKSDEEAERHRQEYSEMVAGAKRRELKEAQKKKRQIKERYRQEDSIASAMVIWNSEVLPNWESMRNTRRVRELWWQGLPPSVRGKVWGLAIGNELNITSELYEIFLSRAKEKWRSFSETGSENETEDCGASLADRESSLDLIKLDISRTFPSLYIFQKGGPYHDLLHNVLGAYTCYRPDVGYVQGMSFIAAVLILNLEEADAFIAFANLLNKPCQMAFFRVDHDLMLKYFAAFEVFFEENLPRLFQHFQSSSLTPDLYLIDWIFTLYSKSLPLDVACRVWDVFCRDGEEALFRTGLGILRLYQDVLLQMDFIHGAQFLSRLPDNTPAHTLFTCIANTQMISSNRRWNQVFTALMKDGIKEADKNSSPALRS